MSISLKEIMQEPDPYKRFCKLVDSSQIDETARQYISSVSSPNCEMFVESFVDLLRDTHGSSFNELDKYRKNIPKLLEYIYQLEKNYVLYRWLLEQHWTQRQEHKRWSKEEDEFLIEAVCEDDKNESFIAAALQRTPTAIRQRITYLVGAKRLSQKVAGKFIGEINGEQAEANLVGTVYKE